MLVATVSRYVGILTFLVNGIVALVARAKFHSTKMQKCSNPHNLSIDATAAQRRHRIFVTLPGDVSCCPFCLFFCMQLNHFCLPSPYELGRRMGEGGG